MPTYEYLCDKGHIFDEFQSIVAKPIEICPVCGGRAVRKISGGTGLIFKGSGFYITDYPRKGKGDKKESEAKPKSAESSPTPPKPDTSSGGKES